MEKNLKKYIYMHIYKYTGTYIHIWDFPDGSVGK